MSQLPGRVITFYSFKGGTGRSMALANIAMEVAQRNGNRVLVIDWDLEAAGLHRYFRPYLSLDGIIDRDEQITSSPGLIELICAAREAVASNPGSSREELVGKAFQPIQIEDFILRTDLPSLSLMKAGRFDASYSSRINSFDWTGLFAVQPQFFGAFADYLASQFTHVLIDSRTGYTDISGICTSLLPDTLVAVFTPNLQSLDGAVDAVKRAVTYRTESDDLRPLRTFPLVSRVELSELKLNDSWRFGDLTQGIQGYQPQFERAFENLYGIESCNLTEYFDQAQVAYVPYYSFGEKIAARSEESGTIKLSRSFSDMTDMLLSTNSAWEFRPIAQDSEPKAEVPWDKEWFENQWRPLWQNSVEARASLTRVRPSTQRSQLLSAIRGADSAADTSPVGVPPNLPQPRTDSVNTVMPTKHGTLAYWVVRVNGDCLLVRSLPHRPNTLQITAKELVESVADTLMNLRRLYANLGVTPRAEVRLDLRLPVQPGTELFVPASRYGGLAKKVRTVFDPAGRTEEVVLGRIENDLVTLTRRFVEPLIGAFEGSRLDDETYERIVGEVRAASAS